MAPLYNANNTVLSRQYHCYKTPVTLLTPIALLYAHAGPLDLVSRE